MRAFLKELKAEGKDHSQEFWDSRSKTKVLFNDLVLPRLREWEIGIQSKVLRDFCKSIGVASIRFHDLRATFITNMLSQGVPKRPVRKNSFNMSDRTADLLIRFLNQNDGQLSDRARNRGFSSLKEDEIQIIENKYLEVFKKL